MNLPNKLTLSRLLMTAIYLVVMFCRAPYHESIALVLFIAASITDYYDGMIARRDKLITNFGILMDPLADKILTCSAFIAFVGIGVMPAWMVVIIVARELGITGLRMLAASKNVVLAAERYGKHKTVSQMVAIIAIMIQLAYQQWNGVGTVIFGGQVAGRAWVIWFAIAAQWVSVLLTFASGSLYLWRNRQLYLEDI